MRRPAVTAAGASKSKASRSGKRGEQILAAYHEAARLRGVARLFHVPTPTAGFPPHLRFAKPSTVDSVGWMLDGSGRVVAEEIKTCTSRARFAMSEVEPHQRAFLDDVHEAGGVAVLTVVWGLAAEVCVLPWVAVRDGGTLGADDLRLWLVTPVSYLNQFARRVA